MGLFDEHGQISSIIGGTLIVMSAIICYTVVVVVEICSETGVRC